MNGLLKQQTEAEHSHGSYTGIPDVEGVWKTRNAGTTRISRNGFIFAITVTCKHYRATDGEDFATELTQFFY